MQEPALCGPRSRAVNSRARLLFPNRIVNAADFKVEALPPDTWFTVFGQNLGDAARWTSSNTFTLRGASVTVCAMPAAVSYNAWGTGDCVSPTITVDEKVAAVLSSGGVEAGLCQLNFLVASGSSAESQLTISTSPHVYTLSVAP